MLSDKVIENKPFMDSKHRCDERHSNLCIYFELQGTDILAIYMTVRLQKKGMLTYAFLVYSYVLSVDPLQKLLDLFNKDKVKCCLCFFF